MKTVFTNNERPHVWYYGPQQHGRNAGQTFFFNYGVIYSYGDHFPIARKVNSRDCVLITTDTYSNTTAQHVALVCRAIPNTRTLFAVKNVLADSKSEHVENLAHYRERIAEVLIKAARARTQYDEYVAIAQKLTDEGNAYSKSFKLGRKLPALPVDKDAVKSAVKKQDEKLKKEKARAEKKRRNENVDKIAAWLAGESDSLPRLDTVYMRVNGDNIQTSQGVTFPVSDARKAFNIILRVKSNGKSVTTNPEKADGYTVKLGGYAIDIIHCNGDVTAGCHFVKFEQIEFCAKQLGLV